MAAKRGWGTQQLHAPRSRRQTGAIESSTRCRDRGPNVASGSLPATGDVVHPLGRPLIEITGATISPPVSHLINDSANAAPSLTSCETVNRLPRMFATSSRGPPSPQAVKGKVQEGGTSSCRLSKCREFIGTSVTGNGFDHSLPPPPSPSSPPSPSLLPPPPSPPPTHTAQVIDKELEL